MQLSDFKAGDKVRYVGVRDQYKGCTAVVRRVVKSRKVVTIGWDHVNPDAYGYLYDAYPSSLELLNTAAQPVTVPN